MEYLSTFGAYTSSLVWAFRREVKVEEASYKNEEGVITVGSKEKPLNYDELATVLKKVQTDKEKAKKIADKVQALVIYGDQLHLYQDCGIVAINPNKLILIGAKVVHPLRLYDAVSSLRNHKWRWHEVDSVDEALKDFCPAEQGLYFVKVKYPKVERDVKEENPKNYKIEKGIISIGSEDKPLNLAEMTRAMQRLQDENDESPVGEVAAIIIYGKIDEKGNKPEINENWGIYELHPKKLILVNTVLIRKPIDKYLDDALSKLEWLKHESIFVVNPPPTLVQQLPVKSIQEALNHQTPRRPDAGTHYVKVLEKLTSENPAVIGIEDNYKAVYIVKA